MNKKFFIDTYVFYFVLFRNLGIPNEIIHYIVENLVPYGKRLNLQLNLCESIKLEYKLNRNINIDRYEKNWNLDKREIKYIKRNSVCVYPFIKDYHSKFKNKNICGCDLCTFKLDYPRYIYLKRIINNPVRGLNSKLINQWYLFLFNLLLTSNNYNRDEMYYVQSYNYEIAKRSLFGFCSKFSKNWKCEEYHNIHILIGEDKGKWLQLREIWKNILFIP